MQLYYRGYLFTNLCGCPNAINQLLGEAILNCQEADDQLTLLHDLLTANHIILVIQQVLESTFYFYRSIKSMYIPPGVDLGRRCAQQTSSLSTNQPTSVAR